MVPHNADDNGSEQPSLDELISLREAAEPSGLSGGHLRLLISQGKLWGTKIGRNWVTTAQAVEEYLAQDRRPGPKPKKPRNLEAQKATGTADLSPSLSGLGESRVYHSQCRMQFSYSRGRCVSHATSQRPSGSSTWALLFRLGCAGGGPRLA
jgi:hypothetical protein